MSDDSNSGDFPFTSRDAREDPAFKAAYEKAKAGQNGHGPNGSRPGEGSRPEGSSWQNATKLPEPYLRTVELPARREIINDLLWEGPSLLSGDPRAGKTLLAMQMAYAVAAGGWVLGQEHKCETPGDVLYLALEDEDYNLQDRIKKMFGALPPAPRLTFVLKAPTIDQGLVPFCQEWIREVENPTLVVLDVLARIAPENEKPGTPFFKDYRMIAAFRDLIIGKRGLSGMLIHHNRKQEALKAMHKVSGTQGLTAAVHTTFVLEKKEDEDTTDSAERTLHIEGKHRGELKLALRLDSHTLLFTSTGLAKEKYKRDVRQKVLEFLQGKPKAVWSVSQIASRIGYPKRRESVSRACYGLETDGLIHSIQGKVWKFGPQPPETTGKDGPTGSDKVVPFKPKNGG